MSLFAGGIATGVSLYEDYLSTKGIRDQAKGNIESIEEQIALLNKQKEQLTAAYEQKKEIVTDQFGNKVSFLTETTGEKLGDIREGYDIATSKSGLAFSGTLETKRGKVEERTKDAFGYKKESLYDQLGQSLFNIEMQQMEKFGEIDTTIAGLNAQKRIEQQRKKEKFLGLFS